MIETKMYSPYDFDDDEWRDLQGLARDAFRADLVAQRTDEEIDVLVGWDDPARYNASHLDPNTEVGQRYAAQQEFRNPRVAIAKDGQELVGFGYIASNVSGETPQDRDRKYQTIVKRYAWIREIVVDPRKRHMQAAAKIGATLLGDEDIHALQPVTAYIWPQELPHLYGMLGNVGFKVTGSSHVHPFGEQARPTEQMRMQARTAFGVRRQLRCSTHKT